ncbi:hypothetical protein HR51_16770 [Burkholderia cepacia]|nr:hypothetical protein HR51_16770 [Burkholderia cepacia]
MKKEEIGNFEKVFSDDLRSSDDGAKAEFYNCFGAEIDEFAKHMAITLWRWHELYEALPDNDERQGMVVGIVFTTVNLNAQSFKVFISGYTVAAGALFRQVMEGIALALLCSTKGLTVLDNFVTDKYSTNDAIHHLNKNAKSVGVNLESLKKLNATYRFFHKFSHPTKLTIAASANFSKGATPNLGAFFDPAKRNEYKKDIAGRISFTRVLPNALDGVARNLKAWSDAR